MFVTESQHEADKLKHNCCHKFNCRTQDVSKVTVKSILSVCAPECPHHTSVGWIVDLDPLPNYLWCHKLIMNVETDVKLCTNMILHSDTQTLEEQEENHSSDWRLTYTSDWSDICFCLFSCVVVSWSFGACDEPDQLLWLDPPLIPSFLLRPLSCEGSSQYSTVSTISFIHFCFYFEIVNQFDIV